MKVRFRDLGIKLYSFFHRKSFLNNGILRILSICIYIYMERERDDDNNSQLTTIVKTTTIKLSNFQFTKVSSPNSSYRGIISNNTKQF